MPVPRDTPSVEAGQVRATKGGELHVLEALEDGFYRVSWEPPAGPDEPPFTDTLHESSIAVYTPILRLEERA